jgi:hypothetical protein
MRSLVRLSIVAAGFVAACGSSDAIRARAGTDNCGSAYVLVARTAKVATACGGVVGYPPAHVALRPRERFLVRQTPESTGKLDFPTLLPSGSVVKLLSSHGASAEYLTSRVGRADLIAHTRRYCERSVQASCVAFVVSVR